MSYSSLDLVKSIIEKNNIQVRNILEERIDELLQIKLRQLKESYAAKMFMIEETDLEEAKRFRIVRARIRNGKVQRRKKVSNVKGFTFRKGRMIRMSSQERRHRRQGQRRGKIKRRAERSRIRIHMKRSLRKRNSLHLKPMKHR